MTNKLIKIKITPLWNLIDVVEIFPLLFLLLDSKIKVKVFLHFRKFVFFNHWHFSFEHIFNFLPLFGNCVVEVAFEERFLEARFFDDTFFFF